MLTGFLETPSSLVGELVKSSGYTPTPPTPGRVGDHFVAVLSDTPYTVLQTSVHSYTIVEEES